MAKRIYMAAKLQSFIVCYAQQHPSLVFAVHDLMINPSVGAMGAEIHHVHSAVRSLCKAGALEKVRLYSGRDRNGYTAAKSIRLQPSAQPSQPPISPAIDAADAADVKVTVTTAGTLMIKYKGVRIEIGVES